MIQDLLSFLIMPYTFTVLLIFSGLLVRHYRSKLLGNLFIGAGAGILYLFSTWTGAWLLITPLETRFKPLLHPQSISDKTNIVVLSGGHYPGNDAPVTSLIGSSTLFRVTEGIRIQNQIPRSKLVLMSGKMIDGVYTAEITLQLLDELKIENIDVTILNGGNNTELEAKIASQYLDASSELILVTSSYHMPRAMLLFKYHGFSPIPAPVRFDLSSSPDNVMGYLKWNPDNLKITHKATHEYAGIAWSWIRGLI